MVHVKRVVGLTALLVAASTSTASAQVERVAAASVTDSATTKTSTAVCPAGKQVVGAGGGITGGFGQVLVDGIKPASNLTSVTVSGREDSDGTSNSWSVRAYAICGSFPGLTLAPPATSAITTASKSITTMPCPDGTRLVGTGGELLGGGGHVVLHRIRPNSNVGTVTVGAHDDADPTSTPWRVRAYAICAPAIAGLTQVTDNHDKPDPSFVNTATATCPSGTRLLGTGFEILQHYLDDVGAALHEGGHLLNDLRPAISLTGVSVAGYDGQHAFGGSNVYAHGLCAAVPGPPLIKDPPLEAAP
jgi:hypothetical protein